MGGSSGSDIFLALEIPSKLLAHLRVKSADELDVKHIKEGPVSSRHWSYSFAQSRRYETTSPDREWND
jgi:hypothetical protein